MKVLNRGRGIHEREIRGVEKLQSELPDTWRAFTNLELALPGGGREIDVIMVIEDRLVAVDLKDWIGPIKSENGMWTQPGLKAGVPSPVEKIKSNARELRIKLEKFLKEEARKKGLNPHAVQTPKVEGFVALTACRDRSGISPIEADAVFPIDVLIKALKTTKVRIETIGGAVPCFHKGELLDAEWTAQLSRFFNVQTGAFRTSTRQYGSYRAINDNHCYEHPKKIYAEYDVEDATAGKATGLLRRWDFTKADVRFQTEEGRSEIAGRERQVIAWLNDRNPAFESALLQPRAGDPELTASFWEVFDKRRKLRRLTDILSLPREQIPNDERLEMARQILTQARLMHDLQAAHLDIGSHSVWLEGPSTVKFSHLMASSFPEVKTLGIRRYQFLSTAKLPEEALGENSTPLQKDVFLLGCVIHALLFGRNPSGQTESDPPEWNKAADLQSAFEELHGWMEVALEWTPSKRFANASVMLDAFNQAASTTQSSTKAISELERYKTVSSQRAFIKEYPDEAEVREDERVAIWISTSAGQKVLVKMWKRDGWGHLQKEAPRLLEFLEQANTLISEPLNGFARILRAIWLGDAIAVVQEFVEGTPLHEVLLAPSEHFKTMAARLSFLNSLIATVSGTHERGLPHGDLKPDNIILGVVDGSPVPVLVDALDFACSADGERRSTAYSPDAGGRFERDRYAVSVITKQVLENGELTDEQMRKISAAVLQVQNGPPENASLLPLESLLAELATPPLKDDRRIVLKIRGAASGQLLPDEGVIALSKSKDGRKLIVRGACEQLSIFIDENGRLTNGRRMVIDQKRINPRFEVPLTGVEVKVAAEGPDDYNDLIQFMVDEDLNTRLDAVGRDGDSAIATQGSTQDDGSDVTSPSDVDVDLLTEEIECEAPTKSSIDVSKVWEAFIDVEANLNIEGVALGDSSYRTQFRRFLVPFQLELGVFDFDRDDTVMVSRLDGGDRWVRIGNLDLHASRPDFIQIDTSRWGSFGGVLVRENQRLRFTSHFEQTSRIRRKDAMERVLRRRNPVRGLIDVFGASPCVQPETKHVEVDLNAIRSTYGLNPSQCDAFAALIAKRPLGLLQGPPGTGKTLFIGALVHFALTNGLAKNVLLASQSHEAVNGAAETVLKLYQGEGTPSILRVGHEGHVSERLLSHHVARVEARYKDRFNAEFSDRLRVMGSVLGLPSDALERFIYLERTVRPVVDRIVQIQSEGDEQQRLSGLIETLNSLLDDNFRANEIDEGTFGRIVETTAKTFRIANLSLVDRLREGAQLARDFINSTSSRFRNFESFLAGTRQIVAGTCVGLGRASLGLTSTPFDLVVVDEAARCTSGELAVPLQAGRWVVLVGDHLQLEPQHRSDVIRAVSKTTGVSRKELCRSDFERVFESPYGRDAGRTLTEQYRMLEPIGTLVSDAFYSTPLTHGRAVPKIPTDVLPDGLPTPLLWITTDVFAETAHQMEARGRQGALQNPVEAELVVEMIRMWDSHDPFRHWVEFQTEHMHVIGIICTYSAQADLIRSKLRSAFISDSMRQSIKIDTVDSYQGKENPIVVLSLVRNNLDGPMENGEPTIKPGFMARKNRINVAVSRAMDRLVIVGARDRWKAQSPMAKVATAFERQVMVGGASFTDGARFRGLIEASRLSRKKKDQKKRPTDSRESTT